jgi:hypothetical protein
VRWTAPSAGGTRIREAFEGLDSFPTSTDVYVLHNGTPLFTGTISSYLSPILATQGLNVAAGDTIDFVVGFGSDQSYSNDSTGLRCFISH